MDMREQRFGIEIELTGITREKAAKVIANFFGTQSDHVGRGYDAYHVPDGEGRTWKVMNDSSLLAQKKEGGHKVGAAEHYRTEVVSPILRYEDIETLQEIVRALRHKGAFANSSCGIHIHVDAAAHTPKTLRTLSNIMASKEDLLYRALGVGRERERRYCKKTDLDMLEKLNKERPSSRRTFECIWYGTERPECCHWHYNGTRYHALNLHATWTKGTIEFRCFNSTTHAGEVKSYVQLCLAVSNQALAQSRASFKPTNTDNDKYAMRCWLLKMGLIGDEFKTCRHHLTKHLEGNSAWRHAA